MDCIHPGCPRGTGLSSWTEVSEHPGVKLQKAEKAKFVSHMSQHFHSPPAAIPTAVSKPPISKAAFKRLVQHAPCLFNQVDQPASAAAVVHLCELTLDSAITSENAWDAYQVQHPNEGPPFAFPPKVASGDGGTDMELLCSEILCNEAIPRMAIDQSGWPAWSMPGHALMNQGKLRAWKALGDILVPCAPTNLVISVKTQSARERLLYSSNSIEGVGFGFFDQANEFWTESRMTLFKRMGFSAIYLPRQTYDSVMTHLSVEGTKTHAINISGRPLYRPLEDFGADMRRVVGKSSHLL